VNAQRTGSTATTLSIQDLCRAVAEASPMPIAAVTGTEHVLRYVNPAFCHLLRKSREELIGTAFFRAVPAEDECLSLMEKVGRTGEAQTHAGRAGSVEHSLYWSYAMWPLLGADHSPLAVLIRVTESTPFHENTVAMNQALLLGSVRQHELTEESHRLNIQLRKEISHTRQAQEALICSEKLASVGRMAAIIAHEINNPLEAVMNTVFLAKTAEGTPASAREFLQIAEGELNRIAHITRQTLGFYRESSLPTAFPIAPLLESVVDLLRSKIKSKHAIIEMDCEKQLQMTGIAGELRQVLSNLVVNSLDAIDNSGTVKLRVSAFSRSGTADRHIRVTIADNGVGIDSATLPQIFDPFFTTRTSIGNGLGLWVSKQIIDKHGGSIQVRSRQTGTRRGTVFTVVLPVEPMPTIASGDAPHTVSNVSA
jgi:two-component system NtrC family sensor kinase